MSTAKSPNSCVHNDHLRKKIANSRAHSLIRALDSLFAGHNSLFRCVGNLSLTLWIYSLNRHVIFEPAAIFVEFPVLFPVSREFTAETGSHKTGPTASSLTIDLLRVLAESTTSPMNAPEVS
jgi:hypothetical protein